MKEQKLYTFCISRTTVLACMLALVLFSISWSAVVQEKEQAEKRPFSKECKVTLDPQTKIPIKLIDINTFPLSIKERKIPLIKKNIESILKSFLEEHQDYFRAKTTDLKLISANKHGATWYVNFQQLYKGVGVYNAKIGMTVAESGMIQTYSSSYYSGLNVDMTQKIKLKEAVEIARATYRSEARQDLAEKEAQLIIYNEKNESGMNFILAWHFLLAKKRSSPETDKYFIVDAKSGKILKSYFARFPGSRAYGKVEGEIYPVNPTDQIATRPLSKHNVKILVLMSPHKHTITDQNGDYYISLPWMSLFTGHYHAEFRLEGPYAGVHNSDGSDFIIERQALKDNPCNVNWTAIDRDHINVFYHINILHEWYKNRLNYQWINAWDGTNRFGAEVNHNYNNAYAGNPMLFGNDNFARSSDVIYHECTHNVLYYIYGNYIGWPNQYDESYAFDEGFADYFACSATEDPRHGEGYGGTRTLLNNNTYQGKRTYNMDGHDGGTRIAGAAWDLRSYLMDRKGRVVGSEYADRLVFKALQQMSTMSRDYFFTDPQESNFLTSIYIADDDNSNLDDGIPDFYDIQQAFANHDLLRAVLSSTNSYDVSANAIGYLSGGDFYYSQGSFWANNFGQRGVIDLGDIGNTPLDQVSIPSTGYTRFGVSAALNHTYVSLAEEGEEGRFIVFRVLWLNSSNTELDIQYLYRRPFVFDPHSFCKRYPLLCQIVYIDYHKYPFLGSTVITLPGKDFIPLKFRHELDKVVIPVDNICHYVIDCPVCATKALCSAYTISFIDMPEPFGIEVFTSKGILVMSNLKSETNKVISFNVEKLEKYFLVISPSKTTKLGLEYKLPLIVR